MKVYIILTLMMPSLVPLYADLPQLSREALKENLVIGIARNLTEEQLLLSFLRTIRANAVQEPAKLLKLALPHIPNAYAKNVLNIMYGDFMEKDGPLSYQENQEFFSREKLWESYLTLRDNTDREMTQLEVRNFLGQLYHPFFDHLHSEKGIEIFKKLVQPGECKAAHTVIQHFIDYENEKLDQAKKQMMEAEGWRWGGALAISAGTGALVTATTLPFQMVFPIRTPGLATTLVDLSFLALRIGAAGITGYEAYWRIFHGERMRLEKMNQNLQARIVAFEGLRDKMKGFEAGVTEINTRTRILSEMGCSISFRRIGSTLMKLFNR